MRKIKERMCITCNGREEKENLLRWVSADGRVVPDWTGKIDARSFYTHFSRDCITGLYKNRKVPVSSSDKKPEFEVGVDEIFNFISSRITDSIDYFLSICKKSGVVFKGQNLIMEQAKKGKKFRYLVCAGDVSPKTVSSVEKVLGLKSFKTGLTKDQVGSMFDGRPAGVLAFTGSEQTERLFFYFNLLENFTISGDIDAH
jgi:predicted RNA-binding protein YlxR (DUF448 family)